MRERLIKVVDLIPWEEHHIIFANIKIIKIFKFPRPVKPPSSPGPSCWAFPVKINCFHGMS